MLKETISRCAWVNQDPLYIKYHDEEWGEPIYDDQRLFEFLLLEGQQAGLSWLTILKKRENFRRALDSFSAEKMAVYTSDKINHLLQDTGLIRNRLKIEALIKNARACLAIQQEFSSFSVYIWQFVNGEVICNHWRDTHEVPVSTAQSDAMAKDLKQRGFKFVGTTICYAFMQAVGMVNDHTRDCWRAQA